jgi:hypothetical protein
VVLFASVLFDMSPLILLSATLLSATALASELSPVVLSLLLVASDEEVSSVEEELDVEFSE